jgi:hypothetical protein
VHVEVSRGTPRYLDGRELLENQECRRCGIGHKSGVLKKKIWDLR